MSVQIAEAAQRSGLPATTIRYYEDEGLVRAARADNGYRTYGERDVARLQFLARARALGLPVDDLRELVGLWDDDRCAPVADRLRERVAERLAATHQRIAALVALAGDLQHALDGLEGPAHDGPCAEGACACVTPHGSTARRPLPLATTPDGEDTAVACSLHPDRVPDRVDAWRALVSRATDRQPVPGGVLLWFPMRPSLAEEVTALAAAEHECCGFFTFTLQVTAQDLCLEVTGPADAQPVIAAVFGPPGPTGPER